VKISFLSGAAVFAVALLTAACGDSPSGGTPPPAGEPGISVVSGATLSDTVDALLPAPLIVQVNGANGRALADAEVIFLSTAIAEGSSQATVYVSPTRGTGGPTYAVERTDAQGRAAVRVRMGRKAMAGGVVAAVPALDKFVVAGYTIAPGAPTAISVEPADTALLVGGSFALRSSAIDRYQNPREAQGIALRVVSGPVALGGSTVAGSSIGRAKVVAELGASRDTAFVSVVPNGVITAYSRVMISNETASIYTLRLDGAQLTRLTTTETWPGYNASMLSSWSPDGGRMFFEDSRTDHTHALHSFDVATGVVQRMLPVGQRMEEEAWPDASSDGWVYFHAGRRDEYSIYRVRPDGTGLARISEPERLGSVEQVAVSLDGSRLSFKNGWQYGQKLFVMTIADSTLVPLGIRAESPRWLPSGEVAYMDPLDLPPIQGTGPIRAVRPDGSGSRPITPGTSRYAPGFDLSPDGQYLIAATDQGVLTVIVLATGEELPIRISTIRQPMVAPSWRP
jgi:hypothetical protein